MTINIESNHRRKRQKNKKTSILINNSREKLLFILTLGTLTTLGPLAIDLYLPAIPTIARDIGEHLSTIQFTLSAYTIGFAIGQLIYGPLSDRFGRRTIMFPGLIGYIITNFIAALCETGLQLIIMRVLQAMAASAVIVTIPAMVRDLFSRQESAKVMSSILMVMTVAPLIAPFIGAQFLKFFGWKSIFIFLAILATFALCFAIIRVPETLSNDRKLVIPASQLCLIYLSVLKNREVMGCILSHAFFFGGVFAFIAGSPYVYIDLYGIAPDSYGLLFAINIIAMMAMNIINIQLINRLSLFTIMKSGSILACISACVLLIITQLNLGGLTSLMLPILIYISCISLIGPNANALVLSHFSKSTGTANAMAGAIRFGIGSISSAAVGLFHNGTTFPMAVVMSVCGILSVTALSLIKNQGTTLNESDIQSTFVVEKKIII